MADQPEIRDALAGAELREVARFAMNSLARAGRIGYRITRLTEMGFPDLEAAYDGSDLRELTGCAVS